MHISKIAYPISLLLIFLINQPVQAEVEVNGVDGEIRANIYAFMALDDLPCSTTVPVIEKKLERARSQIRKALSVYGYYQPEIEHSVSGNEDCWRVEFLVQPGTPVMVTSLTSEVTGPAADDPRFISLLEKSPLKPDVPFRHDQYETLKNDLMVLAQQRGYEEADWEAHEVKIDPHKGTADVTLRLSSGPRYAFGNTEFTGEFIKEDLLRLFLPYEPGEAFDSRLFSELYSGLSDSGYFSNVRIARQAADEGNKVIPITVELSPAKRKRYKAGVGFSTDTGPRLRLGYANYRVNDSGHQWNGNLLLSPVLSELGFNYRLPVGDPRLEWFSFDGAYRHEETDTSESDAILLSARQVIKRSRGWQETRFLKLLAEDFNIADQSRFSTFFIPGVSWQRTKADRLTRPLKGEKWSITVQGSADELVSEARFLQVDLRGKWVRALGPQWRVLLRGEAGSIATNEFSALPPSLRFYTGGDSSVRGYDFESLGAKDSQGRVLGGKHKLVVSGEVDYAVNDAWSVAAFIDAGNAFSDGTLGLSKAAGLGVRWLSPIGPIRLDIAHPFDDPDNSFRVHFSFGPDL